jgi:hypothetical protein
MAISFASATGNLFNRIGRFGKIIREARTSQASQVTNLTNAIAQYVAEPDLQAVTGGQYIGLSNGVVAPFGNVASGMAALTINRVVYRDNPQYLQALQNGSTLASLREVIRQMFEQGASVLAQTVTATPNAFSVAGSIGDGVFRASVRRPLDGRNLETMFAETFKATCITDSYTGGAQAGNEGFVAQAPGGTGPFNFDWPKGSGASQGLQAIDSESDNSAGNLLDNSSFNDWTANEPDGWTVTAGVTGTNYAQEVSIVLGSGEAIRFIGDGATQTEMSQQLSNPQPLTQFSWNAWLRRDGTSAAAGTLTAELVDQNGNVISDEAGTPNQITVDLTALTTSYAPFGGSFRLPLILPDEVWFVLRQSVPLTAGRSVYFDRSALGLMTQFYTCGPFLAVFGGPNPFARGDFASCTTTNSRGAGGGLDTFQTLFFLLFPDMAGSELLLPSDATPTISDTLITS